MYDNSPLDRLFDRVPLALIPVAMVLTLALCLAAPVALGYALAFAINAF